MEEMDYYEYEESLKRFTPKKIILFILKLLTSIVIISTFAMIILKNYAMRIPKDFSGVTFTESIMSKLEDGEITLLHQEPIDEFDTDGLYHVSSIILSEATGEVQLTVRYNKRSTINALMAEHNLEERPEGEVFVYVLSDTKGNIYKDYVYAEKSLPFHEVRRVVYNGIDFTDLKGLFLDIFYIGNVSSKDAMNKTFSIYNASLDSEILTYSEAKMTELDFKPAPDFK